MQLPLNYIAATRQGLRDAQDLLRGSARLGMKEGELLQLAKLLEVLAGNLDEAVEVLENTEKM